MRFFLSTFLFCLLLLMPACLDADQGEYSTLIEKSRFLIQKGSYEAGIALLETVLDRDPTNSKAFNLLLSAYEAYSRKLIEEGRFAQAEIYLAKTKALLEKMDAIPARELTSESRKIESRVKREMVAIKA
ncbi:MAG TPA: hypothetical protein VJA00_02675, partial [Candidatus Omnitrophota bacterium]|nr:hypothetical protein [Candidatus Omnitrophota bacterium]